MKKKKALRRRFAQFSKYNLRKIDVEQLLLQGRQVFLTGVIDENASSDLIKELIALDQAKVAPIILWVNSPGGSTTYGFAIIDTILGLRSPVITIILGQAASMAGMVSIAGRKRFITANSEWMAHDLCGCSEGKATEILDRADYLRDLQKKIFTFLGKHTKLSQEDLAKARNGELWFNAEMCLKKGIVDTILKQ